MDELFFGGIHEKLRMVSITDSTMMRIVHGAMNKAHERVKSKEGAVERLNEISKFYELAVMQLEGCMKFVQDETSHEEEVLAGLSEIRDQLRGRLSESERAISDKDRELAERAESEARLRLALEAKEAELASLRARLEGRDDEFCELKNSVDHQVWKIRQRLEPDHRNDRRSGDEAIGGDIDALKETLDVAFEEMIKNHECLVGGKSALLCHKRENNCFGEEIVSYDASSRSLPEELLNRISWLEQEHQDSSFAAWMIQETYGVLFKGMCRDIHIASQIREEIHLLVLSEALRDFGFNYNLSKVKIDTLVCRKCKEASVVNEEIYQSVALETAKDAFTRCKFDDQGDRPFERLGAVESLVQNVDLSVQGGDFEPNGNSTGLHFRALQCDTLGEGNACGSSTSSLRSVFADPLVICDRESPAILHMDSTLASVPGFFQIMVDFEQMVGEKLELHGLRLEEIYKRNLNELVKVACSMGEQKSLYRKAFIIRCQNLHKAEIEVDLLGDQVEILSSLLHKVYSSLQNNSLISQPSAWALDMLQMIKTELNEKSNLHFLGDLRITL